MRRPFALLAAAAVAACASAPAAVPGTTVRAAPRLCKAPPTTYPADIVLVPQWQDSTGFEVSPVTHDYNPTVIAGQGVARWDAGDHAQIVKRADWLLSQEQPDGRFLYTDAFGGQPNPWWSALPEGMAIAAYLRAYDTTKNPTYIDGADRAFSTFTRTQDQGGVMRDEGGYRWMEEYMVPYAPHVLNGAIWALLAVMEYHDCRGDAASQAVIDGELMTLRANLHRYEWSGGWSFYDLRGSNLARSYYHNLHVELLCALGRVTGEPLFTGTAKRWEAFPQPDAVSQYERATPGTPLDDGRPRTTCDG